MNIMKLLVLRVIAQYSDSPTYYVLDKDLGIRYFNEEDADAYINNHYDEEWDEYLEKEYNFNPDYLTCLLNKEGPLVYGH